MPRRKIEFVEYEDAFSASVAIVSGGIYFLRFHRIVTLAVLFLMLIGPFYVGWQYFTSEQVKIEALAPETSADSGFNLKLMDEAIAAQQENGMPIIINGQRYGNYDPAVHVWKVWGKPKVVIHDERTDIVLGAEIPILADTERMKQYKK